MKQSTISVITFFVTRFITVHNFSVKIFSPFLQSSTTDHSNLSTKIKALVYSWDEQQNEKKYGVLSWKEEEDTTLIDRGLDDAKIIVEHLATDQSRVSSLARLAVAFSPPERRIDLKDIEHIEILLVDGEHIEIVAAVRHEEACVRLLVPVQFPTSCGGLSNMEECVLDNIDALDQDAGHRIEEQKVEDEIFDLSYDGSTVKLPSWWIHPSTYELVQECDTIKRLLNEAEFQNDVKILAMRAVNAAAGESPIVLERVVVTDVGPSGLNFRAQAARKTDNEKVILEVAYKFSSTKIEDVDALRAAVLGAAAEAST